MFLCTCIYHVFVCAFNQANKESNNNNGFCGVLYPVFDPAHYTTECWIDM